MHARQTSRTARRGRLAIDDGYVSRFRAVRLARRERTIRPSYGISLFRYSGMGCSCEARLRNHAKAGRVAKGGWRMGGAASMPGVGI